MKRFTVVVLVMLAFVIPFGIVAFDTIASAEIECYSIAMEITHTGESTYYVKNSGTYTTRIFYLRNNDKAISVNVSAETYARFTQGDWVEQPRTSLFIWRHVGDQSSCRRAEFAQNWG